LRVVGSIVKAGEERFALVAVQPGVLEFSSEADRYVDALSPAFEGLPVVLMAQPAGGKAQYYGREDLVRALAEFDPARIPWREIDVDV
jgi:hypothetical protein